MRSGFFLFFIWVYIELGFGWGFDFGELDSEKRRRKTEQTLPINEVQCHILLDFRERERGRDVARINTFVNIIIII